MGLHKIKKFLNLIYVNLDDIFKFHEAYLETQGDDSSFIEPCCINRSTNDILKVNNNTTILDKNDSFILKLKK